MDDLDLEACFLEQNSECPCEFLLGDDPPDRRPIGGLELASRLLKHLVAPLEVPEKLQPLIDPLRVACSLRFQQNSLKATGKIRPMGAESRDA